MFGSVETNWRSVQGKLLAASTNAQAAEALA